MTDRLGTIRTNIVNAILALPGWPSGVPVEKLGIPHDVFFRGPRTMVGVCTTEEAWTDLEEGIGDYIDRMAEADVSVVVFSTSELSPAGALEVDDGNIDGLVSIILGSRVGGIGPGLRSADVGVPGETGAVRCRAVKTQLIADARRAEGSGGGLAKVILFRTTALPL